MIEQNTAVEVVAVAVAVVDVVAPQRGLLVALRQVRAESPWESSSGIRWGFAERGHPCS